MKTRFVLKKASQTASSLLISNAHAQAADDGDITAFLIQFDDNATSAFFMTDPDEKVFEVLLYDGSLLVDSDKSENFSSADCTGKAYETSISAPFIGQRVVRLSNGKNYLITAYVQTEIEINSRLSGQGECNALETPQIIQSTHKDFQLLELTEYTESIPDFSSLAPIGIGLQGI